jgi:nitrite reductase/ring-hydroxylating ferredoxin subunit
LKCEHHFRDYDLKKGEVVSPGCEAPYRKRKGKGKEEKKKTLL